MTVVNIPLTNDPNQTFTCSVPAGNTNRLLQFFIAWNAIAGYWTMSLKDAQTNTDLVMGLPLITGQAPAADLLRQLQYLGIGSAYIAKANQAAADYPGVDDWGVNFFLIWVG